MIKKFLKPLLQQRTHARKQETISPEDYMRELETDILARTIFGEARSEGAAGMEAVASVVLNRVRLAQEKGGYWWGSTIIEVCHKPYQFSTWNRNDPNLKRIQSVTEKDVKFATALRIARRAVIGALRDTTGGATHYHADYVKPYWARGQKPIVTIGRHIFYFLSDV